MGVGMNRSACIVLLLASMPCTASASAQLTPGQERLAFDVGKVAYNEHRDDVGSLQLIWAITEGHGTTARARRGWLTCHSPRVLGAPGCRSIKTCREGRNCQWTRNLRRDGAMPADYPHGRGHWRRVHRRRWLAHLARAREYVAAGRPVSPCPGAETSPYSWGGRMDVRTHARRAGDGHLYVLMVLDRDGVVTLDNGTTIRSCSTTREPGQSQNYGFFAATSED